MIASEDDYNRTREYVDRLQKILLELRRTHSASQFQGMSRSFLKELTTAQREINIYLATPEVKN